MSDKTLVIVESPTKARTLKKILGRKYDIKASNGHVRDLPKSRIGIDIDRDFEPEYILVRGKGPIVRDLKKAAQKAERVLLASDPDREGEAIAWHLAHLLSIPEDTPCRIRMYEITPRAVKEAVSKPEIIDMDKVNAQQARRLVDRLMGYSLSPLLWKKVKSGLSAGRVQSVALRLICEREDEIKAFIPEEYWVISALVRGNNGQFTLKLAKKDGKNIRITNALDAQAIYNDLLSASYKVSKFDVKEGKRNPLPPFKTSTLQQEAARRLGFTPQKTMRIAQSLYEGVDLPGHGPVGLITYMRTDSLRIAPEGISMARQYIEERYGDKFLPDSPHQYVSKERSQDAHEAIRPTNVRLEPDEISPHLTKDQKALYELIWSRFLASQMAPAIVARTNIEVQAGPYTLKQSGVTLIFEGWSKLWPLDMKEEVLPEAAVGEELKLMKLEKEQKFTKPQSRYTESGLVKVMEEKGIGRPSTYATIIQTLYDRHYVEKDEAKKLFPTELGVTVNSFLVKHFPSIIDVEFTAKMEEELDKVERGEMPWLAVVKGFWNHFSDILKSTESVARVEVPVETIDETCPKCGAQLVVKHGRYGKFIACSAFPE
ncbi:MAG TPA: type I DNA topoisomerase, partial [Acetomicrobium flavidum]|uniref:type I DNA topoisomerase n=1 Tax=Acetomicrobium flavidum TaxID=49896 RepID=UPI002D11EB99|nr:type I DNA topoisomerase [Acetomicrobium flavidum]